MPSSRRPARVPLPPDYDSPMWPLATVRRALGDLSVGSFHEVRKRHNFPKPLRIGDRRIAWVADEVRAWIAGRPAVTPHSHEAA